MTSKMKSRLFCKVFFVIGLVFSLGMISIPCSAQVEKQEAIDIGTITVMAPQPGVEITTEKTVIRMDEFKKPGEVRTLTDVLSEIGGIDVQRANPLMASPGDEVSIRGLNEGRMVIEIDGRRFNHTGHYGRYIVDWSTLNMDDIESIEIIRGGHSVLHPFAIGGVINIITKKGEKTDDPKPDVNIKAGYGSYDTYNLTGSINGGIANIVGYNFSASKQETDGYLRNNFQETDSFNGHLTFYLPHEATFSINAKYSDMHYGLPVINDPNDSVASVAALYDNDYPKFKRDRDQLRHLGWSQLPGGPTPEWKKHTSYIDGLFQVPLGSGTAKLHYFQTVGRRWTSEYDPMGNFTEDFFVDDKTEGIIGEYRDIELFDSHSLTVGLEYQELGWPDENPIIYQVKSAYIQDVINLGDRWTITPGVRYYHVEMDTYSSKFGSGWPVEGKEEDDDGFYPSLKADFQATPETALYAAVSRSYRLPCPWDYYWWARCASQENPSLDPESAWEYEAGIIQEFKPMTIRAAGFYYDIENFINDNGITAAGKLGPALSSNCLYNIDHVKLYGAELEAAIRIKDTFRATAAYVYQEYEVDETGFEDDRWTYYLPELLPKHKVKLMAHYNVWEDGWLQLNSRYVYERKTQSGEILDDYITLDVGFEQKFKFDGMEYMARCFCSNVTGTDYQEISGYEMPKHVWGFQVGVKF